MTSRRHAERPVVATREMVRRRRRRRALAVLTVLALALAGIVWATWRHIDEQEYLLDARCEVQVGDERHVLTPHQSANAALVAALAVDRGLPREAAADALTISLQESDLQVLEATEEYDARELFRSGSPSWSDDDGPVEAASSVEGFYDALEAARDDEDDPWTPELSVSEAAEVLERPMDPSFYSQHAERGRAFAAPLTGAQPVGMTCRLTRKDAPDADPNGLAHEVAGVLGAALEVPEDVQEALEALVAEDEDGEDDSDDADGGDAEDDAEDDEAVEDGREEFGPVLIDRSTALGDHAHGRGPEAGTVVTVSMPDGDEDTDGDEATDEDDTTGRLWTLAHWAVATADLYGTQTVHAGAYEWSRDTGRWSRVEEISDDAVVIGF
ncbi:hypothetical protein [Nesterenkonia sp. K-15-9-6]|uniref:hypothetical protein n=1 Tax=Nesterenkonia sp. K-15-9-6 TaxID=3093918 RepID=UPI0040439F8C